jgi:hypothetical protein
MGKRRMGLESQAIFGRSWLECKARWDQELLFILLNGCSTGVA